MAHQLALTAAFLAACALIAYGLGWYINAVMEGKPLKIDAVAQPIERAAYRLMGVAPSTSMSARTYAINVAWFSGACFAVVLAAMMIAGQPFHTSFNAAASYVTNTNWQSFVPEELPIWVQAAVLTTQNFVAPAVGLGVLYALIRGLAARGAHRDNGELASGGLGNFYVDMTRAILYIFLPLSTVMALFLIWQGTVQTFASGVVAHGLGGVTQHLPLGPAASQIAIKQLGTNGGGYFAANSAFPFENPTLATNIVQSAAIIIIPMALCFAFGRAVSNMRHGRALFAAMMIILCAAVIGLIIAEYSYHVPGIDTALGNMTGKETRFGPGWSALWAALTTAASNGSVNASMESLTPAGSLVPMVLMQMGEVVFGGVGSGLYAMIGFVIVTVFVAGLMVGRTPEYLNKKIDPSDMSMAVVLVLTTPLLILVGAGLAAALPASHGMVANHGAHAFSELLYAYTSMGANNGSAFGGLMANNPFVNISGGLIMLAARFVPIVAALRLAGSMRSKQIMAANAGTLPTQGALFIGLLIGVIVLVGMLSLFPALALGPIAEAL